MKLKLLASAGCLALSITACSAGASTVPAPNAAATATPTPAATGPATVTTTATISTTAGQSVAAPVVQGYAPTITTPAFSVPLTGSVTASTDVAPGIATFDFARARPSGVRETAAKPANATVLLYLNIQPSVTTIASGDIAFSFALPNAPSGTNAYYLAFFDGTTWHTDYITVAGTLTSNGVSFPKVTLPAPVNLVAGSKYALALYAVPSNATPAPDVLLQPIAPKAPAGSAPLSSSLGAQTYTFNPAGSASKISSIQLVGGTATLDLPQPASPTSISYSVFDGIPAAIKINHPPQDGVVQGVLGITPAADLTFNSGAVFTMHFTPGSGIVPNYDLGLIVGSEAVTGGTQTNSGGTANISYTLPAAITFPAGKTFYVGFGLSDGGFDDGGGTNGDGGNQKNNGDGGGKGNTSGTATGSAAGTVQTGDSNSSGAGATTTK